MKKGKKYTAARAMVEKEVYALDEGISLLKKTSVTKFDAGCELHVRLGVDPKQADQNIRTTVALPHGNGKEVRVVAFVDEGNVKAAREAGAFEAGTEDLIKKIEQGWLDFDVAVATPDQMKGLAKVAKQLGQKRLMPSPKAGTVTDDFVKAIEEVKKGRIELRVDKFGIVHLSFGRVSFDEGKLKDNLEAVFRALQEVKPGSIKGIYVKGISVSTTMGPGINLEVTAMTRGSA